MFNPTAEICLTTNGPGGAETIDRDSAPNVKYVANRYRRF